MYTQRANIGIETPARTPLTSIDYCVIIKARGKRRQGMIQSRKCRYCGQDFAAVSKIHTFCSDKCRKAIRGNDYRKARARALFRDGHTCTEEGCSENTKLECHHKKPLYLGGDHSLENLQSLCHHHHRQKHKSYKEAIIQHEQQQQEGLSRQRGKQREHEVHYHAA